MVISVGMVNRCVNALNDWGSIVMTADQARALIEKDDYLIEILNEYYGDVSDDPTDRGLDTADRDILFGAFAKHIVGKERWPLNMDGTQAKIEFAEAIHAAVKDGKIVSFQGEEE